MFDSGNAYDLASRGRVLERDRLGLLAGQLGTRLGQAVSVTAAVRSLLADMLDVLLADPVEVIGAALGLLDDALRNKLLEARAGQEDMRCSFSNRRHVMTTLLETVFPSYVERAGATRRAPRANKDPVPRIAAPCDTSRSAVQRSPRGPALARGLAIFFRHDDLGGPGRPKRVIFCVGKGGPSLSRWRPRMHLHTYRDENRSSHVELMGGADHPWTIDLVTVIAAVILVAGFAGALVANLVL
jgi:hypothetical protein